MKFVAIALLLFSGIANAQTTIVLKPSADAIIADQAPNVNFGNYPDFAAYSWTCNGIPCSGKNANPSLFPKLEVCFSVLATVNKTTPEPTFLIFPNPSNGTFTISGNLHEARMQVINTLGQVIYTEQLPNVSVNQVSLNASPGIYFLEILNSGGKQVQKIIIE